MAVKDGACEEIKNNHLELPIGAKLEMAKRDFMVAILAVQDSYALPSYLTDILITSCLADIRDVVKKELASSILSVKEE